MLRMGIHVNYSMGWLLSQVDGRIFLRFGLYLVVKVRGNNLLGSPVVLAWYPAGHRLASVRG